MSVANSKRLREGALGDGDGEQLVEPQALTADADGAQDEGRRRREDETPRSAAEPRGFGPEPRQRRKVRTWIPPSNRLTLAAGHPSGGETWSSSCSRTTTKTLSVIVSAPHEPDR